MIAMRYEKLCHDWLPYEILFKHKDVFGHNGHNKLHSAFSTMEERDSAFDKLNHKGHIEYSKHVNEYQLGQQLRAMERLK